MDENVLVDATIWSLVLRRPARYAPSAHGLELGRLIAENRALIIGPVRQEVLTGVRDTNQYRRLDLLLSPFPNEPLVDADYREAARLSNLCRARGIQGSHVDFLLCAAALRLDRSIFTTDADFARYQGALALRLHAA